MATGSFNSFPINWNDSLAAFGILPALNPAFTGTLTGPNLTTTGDTVLGNAATDTLNVGNGGLVKDGSNNFGLNQTPASTVVLDLKEPDEATDLIVGLTAGTGARAQLRSIAQADGTSSAVSVHTTAGGVTAEAVRIDGAKNVGVGGTSSGARVETFKNSAAVTPASDDTFPAMTSGAILKNLSATDGCYAALSIVAANAAGTAQGFSLVAQSTASGFSPNLLFMARTASSTTTERVRFHGAGGDVSFGTTATNPGAGNTNVGAAIAPAGLIYASRASDASLLVNTNADGSLARLYRSGTQVGSISVTTTTTAYNTTSDERLKENIAPARKAGDVIDALQVREFDFKAGGHVAHGFIAQELAKLCPDAVTVGGDDPAIEPWCIDPSKLVALLVSEVQSLRERVRALEANTKKESSNA